MSDTTGTDWAAQAAQREKEQRAQTLVDLNQLVGEIRERFPQITRIAGEYYGSGDEGGLEELTWFAGDLQINEPLDIGREAFDVLQEAHTEVIGGAYWNNAGGHGTFVLDLASGDLTVDHSWYSEDSEADPTRVLHLDGSIEILAPRFVELTILVEDTDAVTLSGPGVETFRTQIGLANKPERDEDLWREIQKAVWAAHALVHGRTP